MTSSRALSKPSLSASRRWTDRIATVAVTIGATLVLFAVASIFLFLIWASWPLFWNDSRSDITTHVVETPDTLVAALSESEYLARAADSGDLKILTLDDLENPSHPVQLGDVVSLATDDYDSSVLATVSSSGSLKLYRDFDWLSFDLLGTEIQQPIVSVLLRDVPQAMRVQVENDNVYHLLLQYENRIEWLSASSERGPISEATTFNLRTRLSLEGTPDLSRVYLMSQGGLLLVVDNTGRYRFYDSDSVVSSGRFTSTSATTVRVLRSSYGLAVIDGDNLAYIYGLSFGEQGPALDLLDQYQLTQVGAIEAFTPAFGGLITANVSGDLEWLDTDFQTQRLLSLSQHTSQNGSGLKWYMTPEGAVVRVMGNELLVVKHNASDRSLNISSLFERRMYEGYQSPRYIWQSMPLSPTAEAKFSITPLILGTIKAAFYSLLFATPLAIAAAIFTSYFLTADLRARIKPLVELLAAIPTVILGLVAGLWIGPWLEQHLGLFIAFGVSVPICLYLASKIWRLLPGNRAEARLAGFELLFSAAAIALAALIAAQLTDLIESGTSNNLVSYLAQKWGLEYEQRNAIVVGLVMGFAVVPTIYSIAEDALAAVPAYLREGALAMGASEWQAAKSVVLPTAAPGIISAIMMGFARAVGETMIVLMATGNTATMDPSLMTGLRTLSATLALEMPEVVPDSLHFHVLMFIALLLFLFTFLLNSIAEWVRARLRERVAQL
jgi:phosphate transport system permease protein